MTMGTAARREGPEVPSLGLPVGTEAIPLLPRWARSSIGSSKPPATWHCPVRSVSTSGLVLVALCGLDSEPQG